MVVSRPDVAEETLLAGDLPCPRCRGVLRPFGSGRTRTVRGIGTRHRHLCPRGEPAVALTARSPRSCSGPPCREGPRACYRAIAARFGPKHPTAFDLRRVSHFPDRTVGTRGTPDLKVTLTATRGGRVNLADV